MTDAQGEVCLTNLSGPGRKKRLRLFRRCTAAAALAAAVLLALRVTPFAMLALWPILVVGMYGLFQVRGHT